MKNTKFFGYIFDFSVDYDAIDVKNILDIHKYFMTQNNVNNASIYQKMVILSQ